MDRRLNGWPIERQKSFGQISLVISLSLLSLSVHPSLLGHIIISKARAMGESTAVVFVVVGSVMTGHKISKFDDGHGERSDNTQNIQSR